MPSKHSLHIEIVYIANGYRYPWKHSNGGRGGIPRAHSRGAQSQMAKSDTHEDWIAKTAFGETGPPSC